MEAHKVVKTNASQRTWGIRAGVGGNAHALFIEQRLLCLSDAGLGNLLNVGDSKEAFSAAYRLLNPDETPSGSANVAGKFFRFVHEIKRGDLVIYYSLIEKLFHVGRVLGDYLFVDDSEQGFPHRRTVEWFCSFSGSGLSEPARRELGAARTLFEVKRHSEELRRLIGRIVPGWNSMK